jgi:ribosomal protein L40E
VLYAEKYQHLSKIGEDILILNIEVQPFKSCIMNDNKDCFNCGAGNHQSATECCHCSVELRPGDCHGEHKRFRVFYSGEQNNGFERHYNASSKEVALHLLKHWMSLSKENAISACGDDIYATFDAEEVVA